jgi:peptidoglycan/xylan/chitin deacetylase (PgdA/CDA1 family)
MESHFEYGTKAAWWRIADTLERLGVPATVSACGRAAELSPWLIEDAVKRGHEISCHGWRWEKHAHLKEDEEREKSRAPTKVLTKSPAIARSAGTPARRPRPTRGVPGRGRRLPLRQRRLLG